MLSLAALLCLQRLIKPFTSYSNDEDGRTMALDKKLNVNTKPKPMKLDSSTIRVLRVTYLKIRIRIVLFCDK